MNCRSFINHLISLLNDSLSRQMNAPSIQLYRFACCSLAEDVENDEYDDRKSKMRKARGIRGSEIK